MIEIELEKFEQEMKLFAKAFRVTVVCYIISIVAYSVGNLLIFFVIKPEMLIVVFILTCVCYVILICMKIAIMKLKT